MSSDEAGACIRRWYTVISSCTCAPCQVSTRRYQKHLRAGVVSRVTSEEAWTVLAALTGRGWSAAAIASAAGLTDECVEHILAEPGRRIGATIAGALAGHGEPTRGHIDAIPARRKLQALAALGHPPAEVAATAGLGVSTIHAIARSTTTRITPRVNGLIDAAYRALSMEPGTNGIVRRRAAAKGWAPPLAWDDIDDPDAKPVGLCHPGSRGRLDLGEVEFLARTGEIPDVAARRVGSTPGAVERACYRAGRRDLVAALNANEGSAA